MKAKISCVRISLLGQRHGLGVHGICTGCTYGFAVSAMAVYASLRPKLITTVRAFEAQGNRELFPATRNPSARTQTPAHAVIVPIRRQSRALIVSRRRRRFECLENCEHNAENTHRPMQCISLVGSVAYMHSRHGPIQVLHDKKRTKC